MNKRIIGLSLSTRPDEPLIGAFKVTKGDIGAYQLDIKIYEGTAEIDYSQATTARMVFAHENDGLIVTNDKGDVTENGIAYNVEATEISRIGKMIGSVQLLDTEGNRLTISRFTFDVLADPLEAGGPLPTAPQVEQLVSYIAAAEQALNDIYGGIHISGSYETYEDFITAHPTGAAGEIYLAGIVLYAWVESISAWMNIGQIQGFGTPTDSDTIEFEFDGASGTLKAHVKKQMSITSDENGIRLKGDAANTGDGMYYGQVGDTKGFYNPLSSGVWTPTIAATTGTITTSAVINASYLKIGRLVHVDIDIYTADIGAASGYLAISLPFAAYHESVICGRENSVTGAQLQGSASGTNVIVRTYNNGSPLVNGGEYQLTGTYETDS